MAEKGEAGFDAEWYVVFHKSEAIPFWQWVYTLATPVEFGHMFAFAQTGPVVVFVEPSHAGVTIELKGDAEAQDYAKAYADIEGWTVLRVTHNSRIQ